MRQPERRTEGLARVFGHTKVPVEQGRNQVPQGYGKYIRDRCGNPFFGVL
ncbi:hypothetical protein [Flagellimonas maritima]|nr:hypothetical protein [Allomuricauda aurantiaca]